MRGTGKNGLINFAFVVGMTLLVVPDLFFYGPIGTPHFWLSLADTCTDATLFSIVFFFLKREIAARSRDNRELAKVNRQKTEMLQIASHDLRNPLNAIVLLAGEIDGESQQPAPPRNEETSARRIASMAFDMLHIIEEMIQAAALENGQLQLLRTPSDLSACVAEVIQRNRPLAEQKSQELEFSGAAPLIADIDPTRIKQAVDNLVGNAIKFSPVGSPITVTLGQKDARARIEVTDRGPGLTEADRGKLFGRFQRLSARPTGGETSTGLGLANARNLVELHGGEIGAESGGLGQGSCFWIELPLVTPPVSPSPS